MLDTTIRLVGHFHRHAKHGLNAIAAQLPRSGWNGAPDDPAPPAVTILVDSEAPEMIETLDPPTLPCYALWINDAKSIVRNNRPAYLIDIAGAYCTDLQVDPLKAIRDTGYIIRAARLCMERYNLTSCSEAPGEPSYRALNGVRVLEVASVIEARRTATSKGRKAKMWGFLDTTVVVVDGMMNRPAAPSA